VSAVLVTLESFASSVAAGAFFSTAVRVRERAHGRKGDAALAIDLFSLWWVGLGFFALCEAGLDLGSVLADVPFEVLLFLSLAQVIAFCIGLWGLMFYVAYILTGRRSLLTPLAVLFAFYYGVLLFALTLGHPVGLQAGPIGAGLAYADPVLPPAALTALFLTPPLIAAATYVALFFFTPRDAQRSRVLLVATGTVGWLASMLMRDGATSAAWWSAAPLVLALLSAIVVASAFSPRTWTHAG
jgi:hypothetical protein